MSSRSSKRLRGKGRATNGPFLMLRDSVLQHPAFKTLSPRATKLFLDIGSQYRGYNNGDLAATLRMMKERGWNSSDQLSKAKNELVERGLIMITRQGGMNLCTLYALTCFRIDTCNGKLDVLPTSVAPNTFRKWAAPKYGSIAA